MRSVRAEKALERGRLITKARDGWELTKAGEREIERLKPTCSGTSAWNSD